MPMQIVLLAGLFILLIIFFRKIKKKPVKSTGKQPTNTFASREELVSVTSKTAGNAVTISVSLNEAEFKKRLMNGELNLSEKNREKTVSDLTGFYGQESISPNGQYIVSWADGYTDNGKWKNGHLALLKGGKLLFHKRLQRPNDALVSDSGIVIVSDWLNSSELIGKFVVFDLQGEPIFQKKTSANLGNCALSPNGVYALFETYGSDTTHSNQFFIVDILEKKICNQFERPFSFNTAAIDEKEHRIALKNQKVLFTRSILKASKLIVQIMKDKYLRREQYQINWDFITGNPMKINLPTRFTLIFWNRH
jgi:hypothetical protein